MRIMSLKTRVILTSFVLSACAFLPALAQTRVEVIATALHHVSVVQVPEPVENVALGTSMVHVEWHGNSVLIEPQKAGIDTNMVVFTHRTAYLYEIAAAAEPTKMSYLVRESAPPPPPPPPIPSPAAVQKEHDLLFSSILLKTQAIDSTKLKPKKHTVVVKIVEVTEDEDNYYVRLSATNGSTHQYRLQNPTVQKIDPAFGASAAYASVHHQLSQDEFNKFRNYQITPLVSHGSTLEITDMPPDTTMDWVVALTKPEITPGIVRFNFAPDQGKNVNAVAIF